MSNRSIGNRFEKEFCEYLFNHGYWVHNLAQNSSGQPADIIAVKNRIAYLIDCKVCSNNEFPLSRIESNQDLAMDLWFNCGNHNAWFALLLENEVYMLSKRMIDAIRKRDGLRRVSSKEIKYIGIPIERWLD